MKKILFVLIALLSFALVTSCDSEKTITWSQSSVSLKEGETFTFDIPEKVTFNTNNSDVISINNNVITALKEGNAEVIISLADDKDVTVTVKVSVSTINHKIVFDLDGGVFSNNDDLTFYFTDASSTILPVPSKEGFSFLGWFEGTTKIDTLSNKDYNLKAKWVENTFEISFDLDGGTCNNLFDKFSLGEVINLPVPTKNGYTFIGWFDGEEEVKVLAGKNYNLKAKWQLESYSVEYYLDGGTCNNLVSTFTRGEKPELPTPVKEGFVFVGWYENDIKINILDNKDYKLKAHWEEVRYSLVYDLDGGLCDDLIFDFTNGKSVLLPTPTKEGSEFIGWFDGDTLVNTLDNRDYALTAKWKKLVNTVSYNLNGGTCEGLIYEFDNPNNVVLPTPTKEDYVFVGWYEGDLLVEKLEDRDYNLDAKWEKPEIELTISSIDEGDVYYKDSKVKIVARVLPDNADQEVKFSSKTLAATVDEEGNVQASKECVASFSVKSVAYKGLTASISIKFKNYINPYRWINSIQNPNPVAVKMRAYDSTAGYNSYALGGIIQVLFEDIKVNENMVPVGNGNRPGVSSNGNQFKAEFVAFHENGATGTASSISNYCIGKTTSASWHYSVGNDGVYQQLPLNEVGFHAGDGTKVPLYYTDSKIKAPANDDTPAKVTINQTTGNFEFNGIQSDIKAPLSGNGSIVRNSQLPSDTSIINHVDKKTGTYWIANTYWNTDYNILSSHGGNLNSIGIETAVNQGSNLFYTWALTSKLISTIILPQIGSTPYDVKQHNSFSGKNCPQSIRTAHLWPEVMKLIEAEYVLSVELRGFRLELICDSPYVKSNGLLDPKNLPEVDTEITYQVRMTSVQEGIDETFTYKTTIPAMNKITY